MLGEILGGRYQIINVLGKGGCGQTYLAEDTQRPGHPVCVVKHLKPASQNSTYLKVARRQFKTEAETLEKLGCHDQIPQLLAYFEENQEFYLVQEFVEGHPLSAELRPGKRFSESQVIALLQDVLGILEFVHTYQVIHRDIKPSNLIRRHKDSKLVLVDFGAVKQIQQAASEPEQTGMTVGIGTQGYMPSEQSAGRPRFNSDIYALGMTAIQALTGLRPRHLPENPETAEIMWREGVEVSEGLAAILDKMVRYNFCDRYQSAGEVLSALQQLTSPVGPTLKTPSRRNLWARLKQQVWEGRKVLFASSSVAGCVLVLRLAGLLQSWELAAFDQLFCWRPKEPDSNRVVIVEINEADLQKVKQWPIPDAVMARLLQKIDAFKPRAIGLDIYRDLPVRPGHGEFVEVAGSMPNLIGIERLKDEKNLGVPPPPMLNQQQVGFNNTIVDTDSKVRRSLLYWHVDGKPHNSFALQLALVYLKAQGISPVAARVNPKYLQLGRAVFRRLEANDGAYVDADAGGYQILAKFKKLGSFPVVSMADVINDRVKPDLMRDRIVLIGATASSLHNIFYTSAGQEISAVELYANFVSQILSAALDGSPLINVWPKLLEVAWILGWSWVGARLSWRSRSLLRLLVSLLLAGVGLIGSAYLFFICGYWIPLVPPMVTLVGSGLLIGLSRAHNTPDSSQNLLRNKQSPFSSHVVGQVETRCFASLGLFSNPVPTKLPLELVGNSQRVETAALKETLPTQRISFDGAKETTVQGSLKPNQRQPYSLSCTLGQMLSVQALEGNISLTVIIALTGQTIGKVTGNAAHWQGMLPTTGDYIIEVSAPHECGYAVSFDLHNCCLPESETATVNIS